MEIQSSHILTPIERVEENIIMDTVASRREILKQSKILAKSLEKQSKRTEIRIRTRFIRDLEQPEGGTADTPMLRLVRRGDRDSITLRLYMALLWISVARPYDSTVSSRRWAQLLGIDQSTNYRRRVTEAIKRLEDEQLIKVERKKGAVSTIILLDEGGGGRPYKSPSNAKNPKNAWIKVPTSFWQENAFYSLSTPAVAMLLAILADTHKDTGYAWWSVSHFERRIGLSQSTRARGVKELQEKGFLKVKRQPLAIGVGSFSDEHFRNLYKVRLR